MPSWLLNPALTRSIRYRGYWFGVGCLKEKPFDLNATVYREKTCLPSLLRSTPYGSTREKSTLQSDDEF
ncbi:hypothetical protein [Prochlorococcus marinus]|uniref:hypothetical protein n=2 Tax=Prochlorococcus marinus TaxID=1219 RepID=UPI0012DAEC50|nr:hypothetical protein [Prochlorococcus marinus]